MFHVAAVPAAHATPFRTGHVAYIMRRFELEHFLASIERHQINQLGSKFLSRTASIKLVHSKTGLSYGPAGVSSVPNTV